MLHKRIFSFSKYYFLVWLPLTRRCGLIRRLSSREKQISQIPCRLRPICPWESPLPNLAVFDGVRNECFVHFIGLILSLTILSPQRQVEGFSDRLSQLSFLICPETSLSLFLLTSAVTSCEIRCNDVS